MKTRWYPLSIALVLGCLNLLAWQGGWLEVLVFERTAFLSGEWWRLFTHPFVHVSWYHLLLDGSAFLILMGMLEERGATRRGLVVSLCALGALGAVVLVGDPRAYGYCGLSGVAHGLMAFTSLEMVSCRSAVSIRRMGWATLLVVVAKSVGEATTGQMFLTALHFGMMGVPVAVSHLGGVLGGLMAFAILRGLPRVAMVHQPSRVVT